MKLFISLTFWLLELFNPPLRESLSFTQKIGRAALLVVTILTICLISALGLAVALFVVEKGGKFLFGVPQLADALWILGVSIVVNVGCIMALFQIKRWDQRLISPSSDVPPR